MLGLKHASTILAQPVKGTRYTQALPCRSHKISQPFTGQHAIIRQHTCKRLVCAASSSTETDSSVRGPEDARGAISIGLGLYEEGKYKEALDVFEKGLELPGTGMKRFRYLQCMVKAGHNCSICKMCRLP